MNPLAMVENDQSCKDVDDSKVEDDLPIPFRMNPLLFVITMKLCTLSSDTASPMLVPMMPRIAKDLDVPEAKTQAAVTAGVWGYAVAQLAAGPLSDGLGRRKPFLVALVVFLAFGTMMASIQSVDLLIATLLFLGCAGAVLSVVCKVIVSDIFDISLSRTMRYMGVAMLILVLSAMVGPFLGLGLTMKWGWQSNFVFMAISSGIALVIGWFIIPETLPKNYRAKPSIGEHLRNYMSILKRRDAVALMLSSGFSNGGVVTFHTSGPFVYKSIFAYSDFDVVITYVSFVVCITVYSILCSVLTKKVATSKIMAFLFIHQLVSTLLMLLACALNAGVIVYSITLALIAATSASISSSCISRIISMFPIRQRGTCSAMGGFVRHGVGAVAGVVVATLPNSSIWYMTATMAICGVVSSVIYLVFCLITEHTQEESTQAAAECVVSGV